MKEKYIVGSIILLVFGMELTYAIIHNNSYKDSSKQVAVTQETDTPTVIPTQTANKQEEKLSESKETYTAKPQVTKNNEKLDNKKVKELKKSSKDLIELSEKAYAYKNVITSELNNSTNELTISLNDNTFITVKGDDLH